jgi:hypothetical protein
LIPYLNRGKYVGVDPNEWLVDEGTRRELGETLVEIKRPTFFFSESPDTKVLDWKHPRQTLALALFAAPKFDSDWFMNKPLTWNARLGNVLRPKKI